MPERTINKIMTATEPADVATMAMIECLRQIADGNKKMSEVLEGVQVEVRDVRERLIRIEASDITSDVIQARAELAEVRAEAKADRDALRTRVEKLEAKESEREGGKAAADALLKYGPFVIAIVTALFVILVATKEIVL